MKQQRHQKINSNKTYTYILALATLMFFYLFLTVEESYIIFFLRSISSHQIISKTIVYAYPKRPITVYRGKNIENSFALLTLRFSLNELDGYQDLFQTSDMNSGVRIEIGPAGTIGIVSRDVEGRLAGRSFPTVIVPGKTYTLTMMAANKYTITAFLNGIKQNGWHYTPRFNTNNILIGDGFTPERQFNGSETTTIDIVEIGSYNTSYNLVFFIRLLLLVASGIIFFFLTGQIYFNHKKQNNTIFDRD
ncbi:MAG: hypothetical protein ACYDCX_08250 [Acidithiobacillus sp.]